MGQDMKRIATLGSVCTLWLLQQPNNACFLRFLCHKAVTTMGVTRIGVVGGVFLVVAFLVFHVVGYNNLVANNKFPKR